MNPLQIPTPAKIVEGLRAEGSVEIMSFVIDGLSVMHSIDPTVHGALRHVSISHPSRYPTWDEIRAIKDYFFGDTDAMMVMPRKELYVNIHKNCFHVWQLPFRWECK